MNWLPVCWNYQTLNSSLWLRTAAVLPKESGHGEERWLSQWKAGGITYIGKIPLMPNPGLQSAKLGLISNSIYSTDSLQGLMFNAWRSMAHSIKPIWKRKASVHFTWLFFSLAWGLFKAFSQLQLCQLQTLPLTLGCFFLLPVPRSGWGAARADSSAHHGAQILHYRELFCL